jgi:hypothetical protein
MSLETITERLATINAAITGVTYAPENPPNALTTAHLPAVLVAVRDGDIRDQANGLARLDHRLSIQVWGEPIGQGTSAAANIDALKPFVKRVRDAYNVAIRLDDLANISHSALTAYRFAVRTYSDPQVEHAVLEFDLTVTEKESITYGS